MNGRKEKKRRILHRAYCLLLCLSLFLSQESLALAKTSGTSQKQDDKTAVFNVTDQMLEKAAENPLLSGITLSGGEPFAQCEPMAALARGAKEMGLHVMAYSGYTFEQLLDMPEARPLLESVDVLVDGPFLKDKRSLALNFRGSSNQRILDVPASLQKGEPVVLDWDVNPA